MPKSRKRVRVRPVTRLDRVTRNNRLAAVETGAVMEQRERADVLTQLRRVPERRAALDARQRELVDQARDLEVEWGMIGAALGVSAQAVAKRYGQSGGFAPGP